jgi:phosphoglycerate kinase
MKLPTCTINAWDVKNQTVFLRIDANVTLHNRMPDPQAIRLQKNRPTIDLLLEKQARIIIATHIGRPGGTVVPELSTSHLIEWFTDTGYTVRYAPTIEEAQTLRKVSPSNEIVLLENLRFFPGEQQNSVTFAKQLRAGATYYVNDAFASLHRADASISTLAELFAPDHRSIGLLVQEELASLQKICVHPKKPFLVLLGGCKVKDKLPLVNALISRADQIVLLPALVFTFLKAQGYNTGASLVDASLCKSALKIVEKAKTHNVPIIAGQDYLVAQKSIDGPLCYKQLSTFNANDTGISLGPDSLTGIEDLIQQAQTIFFNGIPGFANRPETMQEGYRLLQAIGGSNAFSVIGGGDTAQAAYASGVADTLSYISTGGGATLALLAGERLPGLVSMLSDRVLIDSTH